MNFVLNGLNLTPSTSGQQSTNGNITFVCSECQKESERLKCGYCSACYRKCILKQKEKTIGICKQCEKEKLIYCKEFCSKCYFESFKKSRVCQGCQQESEYYAKGFCRQCYNKKGKINTCQDCQEEKQIKGNGFCQKCYDKRINKPVGICKECKEEKQIDKKGFCQSCYRKKGGKITVCKECQNELKHYAFGFCYHCYRLKVVKPRLSATPRDSTPQRPKNLHAKTPCSKKKLNVKKRHEILCEECQEVKIYFAKDMCRLCYLLHYRYGGTKRTPKSAKSNIQESDFENDKEMPSESSDQEFSCQDNDFEQENNLENGDFDQENGLPEQENDNFDQENNTLDYDILNKIESPTRESSTTQPSQMFITLDDEENSLTNDQQPCSTSNLSGQKNLLDQQNLRNNQQPCSVSNSPMVITLDDDELLPSQQNLNVPANNLLGHQNSTSQRNSNNLLGHQNLPNNAVNQQRQQLVVPRQINYVDLSSGDENDDGVYD